MTVVSQSPLIHGAKLAYPLPFAMEEYKVNVGTRTLLLPFKRTNL